MGVGGIFRDLGGDGGLLGVCIWSERVLGCGSVRICPAGSRIVRLVEVVEQVAEQLFRVGEQCEVGRGGRSVGALEFAEGEALFAEEGGDGGQVVLVDVCEALGRDGRLVVVVIRPVVEEAERALGEELFEEGVEGEGVVDGESLVEGVGEVGVVVVEVLEVVVDGGAGDVELLGDLVEGFALVVEQLGVEDAGAALGGELHGGAPYVLMFC